ncbi:MAG: O-antigen ligase family protein, partial [Nitrospirota bacterium]
SGYASGLAAGNSILITTHGIFHYLKYFFAIFIYAAFFRNFAEFKNVFRMLLIIAFFLTAVALIQEIWAIIFRYILNKNIGDSGMYILRGATVGSWRLGIYRAPSFIGHYNILGLYCLLMMTIYLSTAERIKYSVPLSFFAGVFFSVSRMIYLAALLITGVEIYRRKWIMIIFFIPLAVMLFYMRALPDLNVGELIKGPVAQSEESIAAESVPSLEQYRIKAREKGLEVWKDNPVFGVGPGMFGSEIAFQYNSPVYGEYNFDQALNWFQTLDQFWPQVLAETGIIGTGAFAGLLITLFYTFARYATRITTDDVKGLFTGLAIFMPSIIIFSLGGILNHPPILFTYCALAGMGLGSTAAEDTHMEPLNY